MLKKRMRSFLATAPAGAPAVVAASPRLPSSRNSRPAARAIVPSQRRSFAAHVSTSAARKRKPGTSTFDLAGAGLNYRVGRRLRGLSDQ